MRLIIRRDQADVKSVFGGHKGVNFSLWYQLQLTPAETDLVQRYKLAEHVLCENGPTLLTVGRAVSGNREEMSSVAVLLNNERVVRDACHKFKRLLDVASTFGGEEAVEIA